MGTVTRATASCTTRACSAEISAFHILSNWASAADTSASPRSGRSLRSTLANLLSIRSGTMTLAEVIAKQGSNPDAVLAEIAATSARLDTLGLVLDSDPRWVTKTSAPPHISFLHP